MVPLRLGLVCALGVLLVPQAATAGGWWSYIEVSRSHVAAGQRVEIDETVAFSSVAAAEEAQESGRFYVYLLRGFDYSVVERAMREASPRDWWSLGDAEAIQVGQVTVSVWDGNLGRATAAFTMPAIPPATYHLMLCDAACTQPLADVIPATDFTVVADPASARMAHESRSSPRVARWANAGWFAAAALTGVLALLVFRTVPAPRGRASDGPPRACVGHRGSGEVHRGSGEVMSDEASKRAWVSHLHPDRRRRLGTVSRMSRAGAPRERDTQSRPCE
jgi:hypothetical protein